MPPYRVVRSTTRIPVPGDKLVEELFGRVNTSTDAFSLAHMVTPAGWTEPAQRPDFGELTVMVRGSLQVEIEDETLELKAGEAIWVESGARVHYSNPYPDECEYFAVCIPAFTLARAHREDE